MGAYATRTLLCFSLLSFGWRVRGEVFSSQQKAGIAEEPMGDFKSSFQNDIAYFLCTLI